MNCNTTSAGAKDGQVFAVGSLLAALASVRDRRKRRGVRYALPIVLGILALAKLAGEDHPTGMAQWTQARAPWLIGAFGLTRKSLPHRTTYLRILHQAVAVEELERAVDDFLAQQPAAGAAVVISLDGKTLRGTIPPGECLGMHLLAGNLPEVGVVLLQVQVDSKENEIPPALTLLEALDLEGKTPAPPSGACRARGRAADPADVVGLYCEPRRGLCLDGQG